MKALSLVEVVARNGDEGIGAMEAAAAAGLDKTTASRLLRMMTEHGWLTRDPTTRRYVPGRVLVGLVQATGSSQETRTLIKGVLEHLRDQVVETAALHRRIGTQRICAAGAESREQVRTGLTVGDIKPLGFGATGTMILAFCDEQLREQVLEEQVAEGERERVRTQLTMALQRGHVSTMAAVATGMGVVSVPVFDKIDVYGALTIAGPFFRFDTARWEASVPLMFEAAGQLTHILGGPTGRYTDWLARLDGPAGARAPEQRDRPEGRIVTFSG